MQEFHKHASCNKSDFILEDTACLQYHSQQDFKLTPRLKRLGAQKYMVLSINTKILHVFLKKESCKSEFYWK